MISPFVMYNLYRIKQTQQQQQNILKSRITRFYILIRCKVLDLEIQMYFTFVFQGLNVSEELWKMALYTLDINICNSITEELLKSSKLNEEQVAMVTFFKQLNEIYPCRNFETIQKSHHHVKDRYD
jgi:hypothetical protein